MPELLKLAEQAIDLAGNQPMMDALQSAQGALRLQGAGQTEGREGLPTGGGN